MGRISKIKKVTFTATVWRWPGIGAWHFVTIEPTLAKKIKESAQTYGAGFVKVIAKTGKAQWQTALFPQKKLQTYLLSVKKSVRKLEGIQVGEKITITCTLV